MEKDKPSMNYSPGTGEITPRMFMPNTEEWVTGKINFIEARLNMALRDCREIYERIEEFKNHETWNCLTDEPRTWERFAKDAIGIEDVEIVSAMEVLSRNYKPSIRPRIEPEP